MPSTHRRRSSIASLRRASIESIRNFKNLLTSRRKSSIFAPGATLDRVHEGDNVIDAVRQEVLTKIDEIGEFKFDVRDINRVKRDQLFLSRFVAEKSKDIVSLSDDVVDITGQAVINCLQWRQTMGVNDLRPEDFPEEFYKSGILSFTESGGESGHGEVTVFICARRYKKIDGCTDLIIKFVVFCLETIEKR